MCQIKVSVIIPIYGVEKYIEKCARSLFEQTMQDGIEFFFVNDCTKDRSIEILKNVLNEYPERLSQVKIISHDQNKGLPSARNTGLKEARGEYVIHCDSDDWVEPDMYQLMYDEAIRTDADIVGCGIYYEYLDRTEIFIDNFDGENNIDLCRRLLTNDKMHFSIWQRLVKRTIYDQNNIIFDPQFSIGEDCLASLKLQLSSNIFGTVKKPLYHYRLSNQVSMTSSLKPNALRDIEIFINEVENTIVNSRVMTEMRESFYQFVFYQKFYITFIHRIGSSEWYRQFKSEINRKMWHLPIPFNLKILSALMSNGYPKLSLMLHSIKTNLMKRIRK